METDGKTTVTDEIVFLWDGYTYIYTSGVTDGGGEPAQAPN